MSTAGCSSVDEVTVKVDEVTAREEVEDAANDNDYDYGGEPPPLYEEAKESKKRRHQRQSTYTK